MFVGTVVGAAIEVPVTSSWMLVVLLFMLIVPPPLSSVAPRMLASLTVGVALVFNGQFEK